MALDNFFKITICRYNLGFVSMWTKLVFWSAICLLPSYHYMSFETFYYCIIVVRFVIIFIFLEL